MNVQLNRIETELKWWQSKEERFAKAFSFGLESNTALLKEKLRYFERVAMRNKGTTDADERLALRLLKHEQRRMEKQLYPNLLVRMIRRLLVAPILNEIRISRDFKQAERNIRTLHRQLQRSGLSKFSNKVDEFIKLGVEQFTISASHYFEEKERIDQEAKFSKNQNGEYHFEGLKVSLINELKPNESKSQQFNSQECADLNDDERFNLLSGRAVNINGDWKQLDFNDKDAQGNYIYKIFPPGYGFDLGIALDQIPGAEMRTQYESTKLLNSLLEGNRHIITLENAGQKDHFFIEANPQMRSLNIYEMNSRKTTWDKALLKNSIDLEKPVEKVQQSKVHKNNLRVV